MNDPGFAAFVETLVALWFVLLVSGYALLTVLAARAGARDLRAERSRTFTAHSLSSSEAQPLVTVVVPAHNEAASVAGSVAGVLQQTWRRMEVIVVCNGCTDSTLQVLQGSFQLEQTPDDYNRPPQALGQIRSTWRSQIDPRLHVIDISSGGKADAMNCALERAQGQYFVTMDADSLLATDAIARTVLPFAERGSDVVAVGSVVRVLNGATIEHGRVTKPGIPGSLMARIQTVEYARGFQLGRAGWAEIGALPIISGAFAAFRTSALRVVGGFRTDTVGEDMEIVLRLHRAFRPQKGRQSIVFVPRPLCWTEVPEHADVLRRQRMRWQRGLIEAALTHRKSIGSNGPKVGISALPFLAILELFAPVIEFVGICFVLLAFLFGALSFDTMLSLLALVVSLGVLLSMSAIVLEQRIGGSYIATPKHVVSLFTASVLEQLGPRQRIAWWRLRSLLTPPKTQSVEWGGMHHRSMQKVAGKVRD